jgi:hypothetical protein
MDHFTLLSQRQKYKILIDSFGEVGLADKPSAGFVKCYLRYKASLSVRTPDLPVYRVEERKGAVFDTFILQIFKALSC